MDLDQGVTFFKSECEEFFKLEGIRLGASILVVDLVGKLIGSFLSKALRSEALKKIRV